MTGYYPWKAGLQVSRELCFFKTNSRINVIYMCPLGDYSCHTDIQYIDCISLTVLYEAHIYTKRDTV